MVFFLSFPADYILGFILKRWGQRNALHHQFIFIHPPNHANHFCNLSDDFDNINLGYLNKIIMHTLEPILEACPNFPKIYSDEYPKFRKNLHLLYQQTERLSRIPSGLRTQAEKELLNSKFFIEQILHFQPQDFPFSFISILEQTWVNTTIETQWQAMFIWSYLIQQNFFLDHPAATLNLIYTAEDFFYHPIRFAALIHALCLFSFHPEEIIQHGLFHRYFAYQICQIEDLNQSYDLLHYAQASPGISALLSQVQSIHCGLSQFPKHNLLGKYCELALKQVPITNWNPKNLEISPLQLKHLLNILGPTAFKILSSLDPKYHPIQASLKPWLDEMQPKDLGNIISYTLHSLEFKSSFKLLKLIGEVISPSFIEKVLEAKPQLFWVLISTTKLADQIPKKKLQNHCVLQIVEAKDIDYVFNLTLNLKHLFKINDNLYLKIAKTYFATQELELEKKIYQTLKKNPLVKKYIQEQAKNCFKNLFTTIENNLLNFNRDSYLNIRDLFLEQSPLIKKLEQFAVKLEPYPENHYALTSLILTKLFLKHSSENMIDYIDILIPVYLDEADRRSHQQRILFEWLLISKVTEERLFIMQVLHRDFGFTKLSLQQQLGLDANHLSKMAIKNVFCFQQFIKLHTMTELEALLLIGKNKKLIKTILNQPPLINILLLEMPSSIFISFVQQFFNYDSLLKCLLENRSILNLHQTRLSPEDWQSLLGFKNYAEKNLLELALSQPNSLDIILSNMVYLEIKFMPYLIALPFCFANEKTLTCIINHSSEEEILAFIDFHRANFSSIVKTRPILKKLFAKLSEIKLIQFIQDFKDELFKMHPKPLIVLQSLYENLDNTVIVNFFIEEANRDNLLFTELLKDEICFTFILELIPKQQLLDFLLLKLSSQRRFIDFLHPKQITAILNLMPVADLIFLFQTNNQLETLYLGQIPQIKQHLQELDQEEQKQLLHYRSHNLPFYLLIMQQCPALVRFIIERLIHNGISPDFNTKTMTEDIRYLKPQLKGRFLFFKPQTTSIFETFFSHPLHCFHLIKTLEQPMRQICISNLLLAANFQDFFKNPGMAFMLFTEANQIQQAKIKALFTHATKLDSSFIFK